MSDQAARIKSIEDQLHCEAMRMESSHLRNIVNLEGRERFRLELDDLIVDYTRQPITSIIIKKLLELADAKALDKFILEFFAGEPINLTERRSANHFGLRSPDYTKTADYMKLAGFAQSIRENNVVRSVVNLGMGGSDLGPSMVTQGLSGSHDGPKIHYVGNIDPTALFDILLKCDPQSTLFIVTSKSFTTSETLANAELAKNWLQKHKVEVNKSMVAVTAKPDRARKWGISAEHIFSFDEGVGGRYSTWSAVGLPVMIAIGSNAFAEFLAGAHAMDQHVKEAPFALNVPVIMGLLRVWHRTYLKKMAYGLMPYDQRLSRLPAWAQQLEMESNGKGVDRLGNAISSPAAPLIWGEVGTTSQHSFFQWLHQGLDVVPIDILVARKSGIVADDINWQSSHKTLVINAVAQAEALANGVTNKKEPHRNFPGNRPSLLISWEKTNPYSLGRLLALYEYVTIVSGFIWGVNSFDQWGVELGKKLANDISSGHNLNKLSQAGQDFLRKMKEE